MTPPRLIIPIIIYKVNHRDQMLFAVHQRSHSMRLDALESSHPVEVNVTSPDDICEIFDDVSYSKGACLIHMLNAFIGEEAFRNGLRSYIDRHSYSTASTRDLWAALQMVAPSYLDVEASAASWTLFKGFPVVTVRAVYYPLSSSFRPLS
ncbi:unnamed protein product [Protopolystoma xenopodis]|uniref:Peptidase M1 membrane alanine aminopeptidase domain-containing protein n=1 Tax=Protopolystoma xenopodis TaxID=117903 RepID=A0A448WX63_9PLAT|nr:unnamed protein product [Protopolystoma xenopodis]